MRRTVVQKCKYKNEFHFFLRFIDVWTQWVPCKVNVTPWIPTKLTWRRSGVTYFARDPLRSYFDEPQKNEIYFLTEYCGLHMFRYKVNRKICNIFRWQAGLRPSSYVFIAIALDETSISQGWQPTSWQGYRNHLTGGHFVLNKVNQLLN